MQTAIKKLYYAIRWPLGFIILLLRNVCLHTGNWAMWWAARSISVALWLDDQGVDLLPEKADPERIRTREEAKKKQ